LGAGGRQFKSDRPDQSTMISNRELLDEFLANGRIRIQRGAIFSEQPAPLPEGFTFDRIEGMMLGLAIGDSLGKGSEGNFPSDRKNAYGEIRDYLTPPGLPSDDSQMAFWTLEQLITDGRLTPEHVARRFTQGCIYGIGNTVKGFLTEFKGGTPWYKAGRQSAGNGALMRIAPGLIPHLRHPSPDLWADAALCAMITHNDSVAVSSAVAFVAMLWDLLHMNAAPDPEWWLRRFTEILRELESSDSCRSRSPQLADFEGPLWRFLEKEVPPAFAQDWSVIEAGRRWYSGAYLLETVPCVLYILMKYGDRPEEALVRAVNDTKDNDTAAAIVGAAVGALHGREGLPRKWIANLSGRTAANDDGRMFELLEQAKRLWN
jgi:ADP-ribosyl-[dinitrogen reductase] hydrolase